MMANLDDSEKNKEDSEDKLVLSPADVRRLFHSCRREARKAIPKGEVSKGILSRYEKQAAAAAAVMTCAEMRLTYK